VEIEERRTKHLVAERVLVSRVLLTVVSGLVSDKPPKPSLSAWPSTVFKLGKAITLQCRVSHPVLEFSLEWEERATFQKFSVDGDFIITNVEGKGTGTFSCSYRVEAHPNIWSHRSEPLKLMGPAGERVTSHRKTLPCPGISNQGLESYGCQGSWVWVLFLWGWYKDPSKVVSRGFPFSMKRKVTSASPSK
jgi:hypothetical protein